MCAVTARRAPLLHAGHCDDGSEESDDAQAGGEPVRGRAAHCTLLAYPAAVGETRRAPAAGGVKLAALEAVGRALDADRGVGTDFECRKSGLAGAAIGPLVPPRAPVTRIATTLAAVLHGACVWLAGGLVQIKPVPTS